MKVVVFGATGTIGAACVAAFEAQGHTVFSPGRNLQELDRLPAIEAVVWAQGANHSGGISETSSDAWVALWDANVAFVADSLRLLLTSRLLNPGSRLVVVSSVWQMLGRKDKIAYVTTKAALGGFVRAACADLGAAGISINAVLPGVVDSAMTRRFLSDTQIDQIAGETPAGRLVHLDEVVQVIGWLCGQGSSGISGQSIAVDLGWSVTRRV